LTGAFGWDKIRERKHEAGLKKQKKGFVHMLFKERRKHFRYPVNIRVEFIVEGYDYKGWIKNLSKGGVLIDTKELFTIGQAISMTYSSSSFGDENRVGTIVRVSEQGIGVKFRESGHGSV